jgi:hypothetical protein
MPITRRIYVSLPADPWLPAHLNRLKWGVVEEIEKLGYIPEIFTDPRGGPGLAAPRAWTPSEADDIARRCVGAAILGMPRWEFADPEGQPVLLATEFNYYEGALVRTLGLPTLVLVHRDVLRRVVFDMGFGGYVGTFPAEADVSWLHTDDFRVPFRYWTRQLADRRDIFLGYCGTSTETAKAIRRYLRNLGAHVLDWQTDFIPGRTIIDQIQQAAARCTGAVFLFTKDDDLADRRRDQSVPRDNVVFEAGYFSGLKGKRAVLIIRETGSKMPADLGGDIYAPLPNRSDTSTVEGTLKAFLAAL